jgi:YD repeat-containing protein
LRIDKQSFANGVVIDFTYDTTGYTTGTGRLLTVSNNLGRELTFDYTGSRLLQKVKDTSSGAPAREISFAYPSTVDWYRAQPISMTNALNQTVNYTYTNGGGSNYLLYQIALPSAPTEPFLFIEWNQNFQVKSIYDANGQRTDYLIGFGRYGAIKDAAGRQASLTCSNIGYAPNIQVRTTFNHQSIVEEQPTYSQGVERVLASIRQVPRAHFLPVRLCSI